jgi:protease-4
MSQRRHWVGLTLLSLLLLCGLSIFLGLAKMAPRFERVGFFSSNVNMRSAILVLDLEGVIMDSRKFTESIAQYAKDDQIKAIVVRVNSPGGSVGPSQEIYRELKRVREELKKPVIATCSAVAASGAYYAAVAADKIFANPGTLMGSIGVIMEFANLEDLYGWAKIKRYAITTGPYKDTGAEYRPMRGDERELFQKMLSEVHMQFKKAVAEGRKLELSDVEKMADGRVFTGETAVAHKFADEIGTYEDAIKAAWAMAGETGEPEVFRPPRQENFLRMLLSGDEEEARSLSDIAKAMKALRVHLVGQPLYLLPSMGPQF